MNPLRKRSAKGGKMSRRDNVFGVTTAETIIGAGVKVQGELTGEGDMIIDGLVHGTIQTSGDVTIGANGRIVAPIKGGNITIHGEVEGPITAEGEVSIRETGRLTGDVTASGISISTGGIFNGRSTIHHIHLLDMPTDIDES